MKWSDVLAFAITFFAAGLGAVIIKALRGLLPLSFDWVLPTGK